MDPNLVKNVSSKFEKGRRWLGVKLGAGNIKDYYKDIIKVV